MTVTPEELEVQKSYVDAVEKLNEARAKFSEDTAGAGLRQEKVLGELQKWVWVCRIAFVVLLGGSAAGVLVYQKYIDNVVTEKMGKAERFTDAIALAVEEDWNSALTELHGIRHELNRPDAIHAPAFKKRLLLNELWVLATFEEPNPDGTWAGHEEWDELRNDPDFKAMIDIDTDVKNDPIIMFRRAQVALKYETYPSSSPQAQAAYGLARNLLQQSLRFSRADRPKGGSHYFLGMLEALDGHRENAIKYLSCASLRNPADFDVAHIMKEPGGLRDYWEGLGKRIYGPSFSFDVTIMPIATLFSQPSPPAIDVAQCQALEKAGAP